MAQPKRTLYEIVGVAADATASDIALACDARRAQLEAQGSQDASAMALVRHAREVLTDPGRRAAYDARLAESAAAAAASANANATDAPDSADTQEPARRPTPWGLVAVAAAAALIVLLFVARMMTNPVPAPIVEAPKPAPAPPPPPKPLTPAQVLAAASPSIARLQTVDLSGNVLPLGLAVSVDPGMVVSTCHAIPANAQILATFAAGKGAATLVITDEVLDLCKLAIAGVEVPALALTTGDVKAGDNVFVVSPDAPGSYALAEGSVKRLVKTPNGDAIDLSTNTSNGAPVLDASGKLVGIATSGQVIPAAWIAQARSRTR